MVLPNAEGPYVHERGVNRQAWSATTTLSEWALRAPALFKVRISETFVSKNESKWVNTER